MIIQERISIIDFIGFVILLVAYMVILKYGDQRKEPYIIGKSKKIEYLTSKELEERLRCRKKV
ncbi:hypothetical protein [Palaeococcus pacificus]|uniref:hypothetical protein n=1 Tax=Palaeococcus pacificus TaxID=971279 RepID=UPI00130E1088|nr:hypothetical protein [Palaeococcus pacificus]